MNLDMKLFEKFVLELCSPKSKPHINNCFLALQTDTHPENVFITGSAIITEITAKETPEGYATVNGLLFGIVLCYTSQFPLVAQYIDGFIEYKSRSRGENVMDFFQLKAGRKK
jgi:hypothetical protein